MNRHETNDADFSGVVDSRSAASNAKPRILVIEDVDALRMALQEQLLHLGH